MKQETVIEVSTKTIKISNRFREDMGDIGNLAASIEKHGLLQPIGIDAGYRLIFGERRVKAFQHLGRETIPARMIHVGSLLGAEYDENEIRKEFNPVERVAIAKALEAEIGDRRGSNQYQRKEEVENIRHPQGKKTEQIAAKGAGFGNETTYRQAKAVVDTGEPELVDAMAKGEASISAAATIATVEPEEQRDIVAKGEKEILQAAKEIRAERAKSKRNERAELIADLSAGNAEIDQSKRYPVIYADPPWRYDYTSTENRSIENQYPTMTLDDICALDVPSHDDAVLFLWTTSPKLQEGLRVLEAWGFEYRTCAIWDKQKIGMGYYFRQRHEILLVGAKGALPTPLPADRQPSVFSFPRGEHSSKPHEVAEMIESMYPEFSRLEMFCRTPRKGWDVWGNQSAA